MANQPPRPWFRLATLGRQAPPPAPAPAPAPAPQAQIQPPAAPLPRPPMVRPPFSQAFRPIFAQPQPAPPPAPAPPFTVQSQPPATSSPTPPSLQRPSTAPPPTSRLTTSPPQPPPAPPTAPASPSPPPPPPPPPPPAPIAPASPSPPPRHATSPHPSPVPIVSRSPPPPSSPRSTLSPASAPAIISSTLAARPLEFIPEQIPAKSPLQFSPVLRRSPDFRELPQRPSAFNYVATYSPRKSPPKPSAQITPPHSPVKAIYPPPSPFSLPPQLKSSKGETEPRIPGDAEPKRVLIQETYKKPVALSGASKGDQLKDLGGAYSSISKHDRYKEADGYKFSSDSEDGSSVRIITIKGENKGALMELGFWPKRNGGHINGHWGSTDGYLAGTHQDVGETENGHNGSEDRSKNKYHKGNATSAQLPMNAYMNSNVQGVNNSILYNCSYTHHDPGVHFSLSRKPVNGKSRGSSHGICHKDHANGKQV